MQTFCSDLLNALVLAIEAQASGPDPCVGASYKKHDVTAVPKLVARLLLGMFVVAVEVLSAGSADPTTFRQRPASQAFAVRAFLC